MESGTPAVGFAPMQKLRIQIAGRNNRNRLQHLPDIAAVIRTVCGDMQQHFFARHASSITVGKRERQNFSERRFA